MATKPFYRLYYHIVWATYQMQPLMTPEIQESLYRFMVDLCQELDHALYSVNGMEDHLHLVLALTPNDCLVDVVEKMKERSRDFCNNELDLEYPFKWHKSFGALTFGTRDLAKIIDYVFHQKLRHENNQLNPTMEKYWAIEKTENSSRSE